MANKSKGIISGLIKVNIMLGISLVALLGIAKKSPGFIEEIYSRRLYLWMSNATAFFWNKIPFSVAEVMVVIWSIVLIWILIMMVSSLTKKQWSRCVAFLVLIITIANSSIVYYQIKWGLNNYRYSVEELFQFPDKDVITIDVLEELYKELVSQANLLRDELDYKEYDKEYVYQYAYKGYGNLNQQYSFVDDTKVIVKPLLLSPVFSSSGYTGIYLFFAAQPTVNYMPLLSDLPFTACHEIAHQKGFSSEDEANFMAFMSASQHDDILFQYSAYYSALSYVGTAIYKNDKDRYMKLRSLRSPLVMSDVHAEIAFWDSVVIERNQEIHNKVNDSFLKATNQPDGILNYSKVVELLALAYIEGLICNEF